MATANLSAFLRRVTREMAAETLGDQSDRQLVECLLRGRDEAAFEAVVRRHGSMVYRVCWRILQHGQDAEDAFQATFLILLVFHDSHYVFRTPDGKDAGELPDHPDKLIVNQPMLSPDGKRVAFTVNGKECQRVAFRTRGAVVRR
jgi:hypothetical protein